MPAREVDRGGGRSALALAGAGSRALGEGESGIAPAHFIWRGTAAGSSENEAERGQRATSSERLEAPDHVAQLNRVAGSS